MIRAGEDSNDKVMQTNWRTNLAFFYSTLLEAYGSVLPYHVLVPWNWKETSMQGASILLSSTYFQDCAPAHYVIIAYGYWTP